MIEACTTKKKYARYSFFGQVELLQGAVNQERRVAGMTEESQEPVVCHTLTKEDFMKLVPLHAFVKDTQQQQFALGASLQRSRPRVHLITLTTPCLAVPAARPSVRTILAHFPSRIARRPSKSSFLPSQRTTVAPRRCAAVGLESQRRRRRGPWHRPRSSSRRDPRRVRTPSPASWLRSSGGCCQKRSNLSSPFPPPPSPRNSIFLHA